jgi:ethanolamine permease
METYFVNIDNLVSLKLGLQYGWGSLLVTTVSTTCLYWMLIFCNAEMSAAMPFTGGPSMFATAAFGSLAGSIVGYAYVVEFLLMGSAVLVTLGDAWCSLTETSHDIVPVWWLVSLLLLTVLHTDKKLFFNSSVLLTIEGILVIIVYVAACISPLMQLPSYNNALLSDPSTGLFDKDRLLLDSFIPLGLPGVLTCLPFPFWFYMGIEMLPLCAEETLKMDKSGPRGLIYSLATMTFLAILTVLVVPALPPGIPAITPSTEPFADTLVASYGLTHQHPAIKAFQFFSLLAFLGSMNCAIYGYSRHLYALSRGGHLPAWISITHPKTKAPIRATLLGNAVVFLLALVTKYSWDTKLYQFLLNGSILYALMSYLGDFLCYIFLYKKMPNLNRPYRSPLGISGAVLGLLISLATLAGCLVHQELFLISSWVFLIMVILIIPYYFVFVRHWLVMSPEKIFICAQIQAKSGRASHYKNAQPQPNPISHLSNPVQSNLSREPQRSIA